MDAARYHARSGSSTARQHRTAPNRQEWQAGSAARGLGTTRIEAITQTCLAATSGHQLVHRSGLWTRGVGAVDHPQHSPARRSRSPRRRACNDPRDVNWTAVGVARAVYRRYPGVGHVTRWRNRRGVAEGRPIVRCWGPSAKGDGSMLRRWPLLAVPRPNGIAARHRAVPLAHRDQSRPLTAEWRLRIEGFLHLWVGAPARVAIERSPVRRW